MIRIMFMGTPEFARVVLDGLISKYEVCAVVTKIDKERDRKGNYIYSKVKTLALEKNIPVLQPKKIKEEIDLVLSYQPDLIITCAYGQIIPKEILDYPKYGAINVHGSLLPKYRGGAPIQHAIMNGDKETGITIMYMNELMDAGDIISTKSIPILDSDDCGTLFEKLSIVGRDLLLETIPSIINGTNKRIKQNEEDVTYASVITKEDEHINLDKSSLEIKNLIRALSPKPGAYLLLDGKRIKIYKVQVIDKEYTGKIGEIVDIEVDGIIFKTKDKALKIIELQIEGKNKTLAKDYLNGIKKEELIKKILV